MVPNLRHINPAYRPITTPVDRFQAVNTFDWHSVGALLESRPEQTIPTDVLSILARSLQANTSTVP
jgi:hypothetical protein